MQRKLKSKIRSLLPRLFSRMGSFKGKGRIIMMLDYLLTDYSDPASYEVMGRINDGEQFWFDLRPWGQKFAFYYQQWEKEYISILKQLYYGGIFVDVGSSLGLYVVCLGKLVREREGKIISIEPVPLNLKKQRRNITLNCLEDIVTYIPCGLGSVNCKVMIKTDPVMADNNAIISQDGNLSVEVLTLDCLVEQMQLDKIGLMKIDVEGYEPMVIEGAKATIVRDMPVIFAEFNRERMHINGFSMEPSWNFLIKELSYTCYFVPEGQRQLCLLSSPAHRENLFFIPDENKLPLGLSK